MTNNQHVLFVGSYAPENKPSLHALKFDSITGQLTPHGSYSAITNPSFLALHPNGKWLFSVIEKGQVSHGEFGSVQSFTVGDNDDNINFHPINSQSSEGDWPCHLSIDATGKWLATANYGSGNAAIYPINEDGSLGEKSAFIQHAGIGPNEKRQEGPHAHSTTFTPDNRFVIVADLGIDKLVIYRFDAEDGSLMPHAEVQTNPGAGPRHLAIHPEGKYILVGNELDNTVTVYELDADKGNLIALQSLDTLPVPDAENTVGDIQFSATGERVYVSNRGHNSVAVYNFNTDTYLSLVEITSCGGNWPRNIAVAPGGKFLLVANRNSNQVSVLPIDADTGALGSPVMQAEVEQAACIKFVK